MATEGVVAVGGDGGGGGEDQSQDYMFKIVMLGDSAVGKSNLINRFMRNKFFAEYKSTIAVEYQTQKLKIDEKIIKAQIWDTAGQERFRAVTTAYYRGAIGAVLVYDITHRKSFESVDRWLEELLSHSDMKVVTILVGNKTDLKKEREVSTAEGSALAEKHGLIFFETSALDDTNVTKVFYKLVNKIYDIVDGKVVQSQETGASSSGNTVVLQKEILQTDESDGEPKKGCCSS